MTKDAQFALRRGNALGLQLHALVYYGLADKDMSFCSCREVCQKCSILPDL